MKVLQERAGFTLIEVLVALALFALIATAAVGLLAWTADQRSAVRARMDRLAQVQITHALLKADLGQAAIRPTRRSNGSSERNAFNAAPPDDASRPLLAFVRRGWENPAGDARASLQYVEYRVVDGRLERSSRVALDGTVGSDPQVLLDEVQSVRAGFYSFGAWSDGWTGGARTMPRAVRLDIQLRDLGQVRQVFVLPEAQ